MNQFGHMIVKDQLFPGLQSVQDENCYSYLSQPEGIQTKYGIFWYDVESKKYEPVKEPGTYFLTKPYKQLKVFRRHWIFINRMT